MTSSLFRKGDVVRWVHGLDGVERTKCLYVVVAAPVAADLGRYKYVIVSACSVPVCHLSDTTLYYPHRYMELVWRSPG
jgi:hypothetical protein